MAKLVQPGGSQALRLPKEFRLPGSVVRLPDTKVSSAHLRGRDAGLSAERMQALLDRGPRLSFFVLCEPRDDADKALRSGENGPAGRSVKLSQAPPVEVA